MLELYRQLRALQDEFGGEFTFTLTDDGRLRLRWQRWEIDGSNQIGYVHEFSEQINMQLDLEMKWFVEGIRQTVATAQSE